MGCSGREALDHLVDGSAGGSVFHQPDERPRVEGPLPEVGFEALVPTVEASACFEGVLDGVGEPSVPTSEDGLQDRPLHVVGLDLHREGAKGTKGDILIFATQERQGRKT